MDLEKEISELKRRIELLETFQELKKKVEELEKASQEKQIFIPYSYYPAYPQPIWPQPIYPWYGTTTWADTNNITFT